MKVRAFNKLVRDLYKEFGGKQNVAYWNDANVNSRRKVFKTVGWGSSEVWEQILARLHELGHTDWELYKPSSSLINTYALSQYYSFFAGIKKYEPVKEL